MLPSFVSLKSLIVIVMVVVMVIGVVNWEAVEKNSSSRGMAAELLKSQPVIVASFSLSDRR